MRSIAFIFLLAASAIGCFGQSTIRSGDQNIKVSGTYKPETFPDEDRISKLEKAFPRVDEIYQRYATENHFPGVVYGIVADGKLIYKGATGVINLKTKKAATTQSLFRIASMTKSFTAMAILKLQESGKLNVADPASKYIPEMQEFVYLTGDAGPVTIRHLLTMTAGFPEDNPWGDRQLEDTDKEFIDFLKQGISFSSAPGQRYEYSNLGYAILGNIITRVSGMPYQDYITENILKPLGMTHTRWEFSEVNADTLAIGYRWEDEQWKEEPMLHDGAFGSMGGLITSLEDFSKYVAFHLSAYPYRHSPEKGPVKRSALREMHKPETPRLYTDAKTAEGIPCPVVNGYGFGLGYRQDCGGVVRISHSGGLPGFGSEYRFYPDYGIGIICFANRTYAGAGAVNAQVFEALLSESGIRPGVLPVSDILNQRKAQLIKVLQSWNDNLSREIFAENFFLDRRKDSWVEFSNRIFKQAGKTLSVTSLSAENQLRGTFTMTGEKGNVKVHFTLSPEYNPKIQQLDLEFITRDH